MRYTWGYAIFHWFIHYFLTIMLVTFSGIVIFPIFLPYTLFGFYMADNIVDHLVIIVISSLPDLDHLPALRKFGRKKYMKVEKRYVAPLHNFFFLAAFSVAASFSLLFISKVMGVLFFAIALHLLWDILEDILIFKISFRRWEKTWGLDRHAMDDLYKELVEGESPQKENQDSNGTS
jgi:hypothetical protein